MGIVSRNQERTSADERGQNARNGVGLKQLKDIVLTELVNIGRSISLYIFVISKDRDRG